MNRRHLLAFGMASPFLRDDAQAAAGEDSAMALARIERAIGGRIGVFALDSFSKRTLKHRPDERFAMCSTFKWLLAAQLLSCVDRKRCSLHEQVNVEQRDLLQYAPVTSERLKQGQMSLLELAKAAVTVSDNTAANLLLRRLGGPTTFTAFTRLLGDAKTRLDRIEPDLNTNEVDDIRDTTTPRSMALSLQSALTGSVLSGDSKRLLLEWLRDCETGYARLRAGLPRSWLVGDKTGTGGNHAINDIAVAHPPGRGAVFIAAYMTAGSSSMLDAEAAHAEIAKQVVRHFGGLE